MVLLSSQQGSLSFLKVGASASNKAAAVLIIATAMVVTWAVDVRGRRAAAWLSAVQVRIIRHALADTMMMSPFYGRLFLSIGLQCLSIATACHFLGIIQWGLAVGSRVS